MKPRILMIDMKFYFCFICALMLGAHLLNAQVELEMGQIRSNKGSRVNLDILVGNFSDVASCQFSINYDSAVLEFLDVSKIAPKLAGFSFSGPNGVAVDKGELTMFWYDLSGGTQSLSPGDILCSIQFELIGDQCSSSVVHFSDTPTDIEFGDGVGNEYSFQGQDGKVSIEGTDCDVDMEMVWVEGGTFVMGCTSEQEAAGFAWCQDDERPVHQVNLSSFYIGKFEVTQGQWEAVMGDNPSYFNQCGMDCPVERISRYSMIVFCNELSLRHGYEACFYKDEEHRQAWDLFDYSGGGQTQPHEVYWKIEANGYHLPTEAQWEYAARGGLWARGYLHAGGNDVSEVGWYLGNCQNSPRSPRTDTRGIHPVGKKTGNELQIYDMSGNVSEWCWDDLTLDYGSEEKRCNPLSSPGGDWEDHHPYDRCCPVVRGGSWSGWDPACRVSNRYFNSPSNRRDDHGFRLARF